MCTKVWIFFTKTRLEVSPPPRRRKYRELDSRLELVRHSYELGVYTMEEYLTQRSDTLYITTKQNCYVCVICETEREAPGFQDTLLTMYNWLSYDPVDDAMHCRCGQLIYVRNFKCSQTKVSGKA